MRRSFSSAVISAVIFFLGYPGDAIAGPPKPPLAHGMSMGEVVSRWGEPSEKIEHEARRTVVWFYPLGKVIFQQGKLVVFPATPDTESELAAVGGVRTTARQPRPEPPSEFPLLRDQKHDDLFVDVLKEVPSDDEKGVSSRGGPPTGGPSVMRQLPPPISPPAMSDSPDVPD